MTLPRLQVDFVQRRHPLRASWIVAAAGALAVTATLIEQHRLESEAAGLEARITASAPALAAHPDTATLSLVKEAQAISQRLATPWSGVLDDLEAASRDGDDSIAVLSVQPDREARRVTLVAEARSLPAALNYVQRLQRGHSLRHPMLDSHDVRTDSAERPVRVQITAEWKLPT
jgi:hypothetical protein